MAVFEVEANGKRFEMEAPDQQTAINALRGLRPKQQADVSKLSDDELMTALGNMPPQRDVRSLSDQELMTALRGSEAEPQIKLEINGRIVSVDRSFLKLSREQQHETVDEIAQALGMIGGQNAPQSSAAQQDTAGANQKRIDPVSVGASQGLTLGFGDELFAGVFTPAEMVRRAWQGQDRGKGLIDRASAAYDDALARERGVVKRAESESPIASTIGNVAGGLVTGGQAAKAGLTLLNGARPTPQMIGRGAAEGAIYGGVTGAGTGEGAEDRIHRALTGGSFGGLAGGGIGGVAGVVASRAARAALPTGDEVAANASAAYKMSEDAGVVIKPQAMQRFAETVQREFAEFGYLPALQPKGQAVLAELQRIVESPTTLKGFDQFRKVGRSLVTDADDSTRKLGGRLLETIDDFADNLKHGDVLAGNVTQGVRSLQEARKNWRIAKKSELIDEAMERATNNAQSAGTGGNFEHAVRQQFKTFLNNPKLRRQFSDDEIKAIRQVVGGSVGQNLLRLVGKLSPNGSGLMLAMHGFGAMASGGASAPLMLAGAGAKKLADMGAQRSVNRASAVVRNGGQSPQAMLSDLQRILFGSAVRGSGQQAPNLQTLLSPRAQWPASMAQ